MYIFIQKAPWAPGPTHSHSRLGHYSEYQHTFSMLIGL